LQPVDFQSQQNMVNMDVVLALRAQSRERRRASTVFRKLQDVIEWDEAQGSRPVETLNEAEYRAKRRGDPAADLPTAKAGESDFYLKEVFAIASDYVSRAGAKTAVSLNFYRVPASNAGTNPMPQPLAPPREDPTEVARRERANQREAARQAVQYWEDQLRVIDNNIVGARLGLVVAQTAYNNSERGSAGEFLAQIGYIAAQRALAEQQRDRVRADDELRAARNRHNQLRD
jgi:hypothetical protein